MSLHKPPKKPAKHAPPPRAHHAAKKGRSAVTDPMTVDPHESEQEREPDAPEPEPPAAPVENLTPNQKIARAMHAPPQAMPEQLPQHEEPDEDEDEHK